MNLLSCPASALNYAKKPHVIPKYIFLIFCFGCLYMSIEVVFRAVTQGFSIERTTEWKLQYYTDSIPKPAMQSMPKLASETVSSALQSELGHAPHPNPLQKRWWSLIGWTSLWMFLLGGLGGVILGLMNENHWFREINYFYQALAGSVLTISLEYLFGYVLNLRLHLNLWYYGGINLNHQICLLFSAFWLLLAPIAFWIDDFIRYAFYNEVAENKSFWAIVWEMLRPWHVHMGRPTAFSTWSAQANQSLAMK